MKKCKSCLIGNACDRRDNKKTDPDYDERWTPIKDGKILHWSWDWGTRCGMELTLFGGRA